MSKNLQKLLRDSLLNNSYTKSSLDLILKKTWENSFSYLYTLQKSYVGYEELHYVSNTEVCNTPSKIGQMYTDRLNHACFDVNYDLIHVSNREEFRTSKYYKTLFTIDDIANHPDIFTKIPIVMIDNRVTWTYQIAVKNGTTTFVLPYHRDFVIDPKRKFQHATKDDPEEVHHDDSLVYRDHKIQILVVDNMSYTRLKTNGSLLKTVGTSTDLYIPKTMIPDLPYDKYEGLMFASVEFQSDGKEWNLGSSMLEVTDYNSIYYVLSFSKELLARIKTEEFYLNMIFCNELHSHTFYTKSKTTVSDGMNANIMVLQRDEMVPYAMPIPVEDLMVWKRKSGTSDFMLEKNTDMVEMYYPNIYRIKDETQANGDMYKVFYFYHYAESLKYTPLHHFYYQFLTNHFNQPIEKVIDTIYRGTIDYGEYTNDEIESFENLFNNILNYQYFKYKYGEMDFLQRYQKIEGNESNTPLEYKVDTMNEWKKVEPQTLRDYVIEQRNVGTTYHLFTNTINLAGRLRTDTSYEMPSVTTFDKEMYVFAINNTKNFPLTNNCRIFVDGLMVQNLYQERYKFLDYLYIPATMITEDSYIEIECFPEYSFTETIHFDSLDDKKEITVVEPEDNLLPTFADLYYTSDIDGVKARYDKSCFKLESMNASGNYEVAINPTITDEFSSYSALESSMDSLVEDAYYRITEDDTYYQYAKNTLNYMGVYSENKPVVFGRVNKFRIQPLMEECLNTDIELSISKKPVGVEVIIEKDSYPYIGVSFTKFGFNKEYIRIYKNGRLIPPIKYRLYTSYYQPRIQLNTWCEKGDILYIDITPYRYKQIFYQEQLTRESTLVNLKNILNKPFDIRYYEVYLNGRKLSINNVFTITPWEITMVNLKSVYNLLVFEKERDYEFFGLDYNESIYAFTLDDLFEKSFVTEDEKNEIIKKIIDDTKDEHLNIYPNTNDEDREDYTDLWKYATIQTFYDNELIPKTFVNPDGKQFSERIMSEEYEEIEEYFVLQRDRQPNVLALDPDNLIEGDLGKGTQYVYCVGHPDDVSDEIIAMDIELKTDENL